MSAGNDKSKSALRVMPEEDPEFQIAPMVDILLVLLVFFMSISSTQVLQSNKEVQLPVAAKAKERDKSNGPAGEAIVNVLWLDLANSGNITIDDVKMGDAGKIIPVLKAKLADRPKLRILIRADRRAPYSFVRPVLVAIGQAGAQNITFSVISKDDKQGGKK